MTKREIIEVDMIKRLITSYFNVVKKNINDTVPKTIITFLVDGVRILTCNDYANSFL
jgi:dynamin 1-like protein